MAALGDSFYSSSVQHVAVSFGFEADRRMSMFNCPTSATGAGIWNAGVSTDSGTSLLADS